MNASAAPLASRTNDIAPFRVMALVARASELAAQGRDIVHFEVGEPDFDTPPEIVAAAQAFLAGGVVRYTNALGHEPLRAAIANFYASHYGVSVSPSRIVVTAGASGALLLAAAALVEPGSEWLLPDPGYPCNRHFVRSFEGVVRALPVAADTAFQPTREQVADAWGLQTRGVMLASPANPTGTLLAPDTLAAIATDVLERGGHVVVDEIYQGLVYGTAPHTALRHSDDIFVINSFSKYFGMTGWRLGWLVVPERFVPALERLAQNLYICASAVAQHAALAAFEPATLQRLEARRLEFAQRRNRLVAGLTELGFGIPAVPDGAFYVYADVSPLGVSADDLVHNLLENHGVACTPGIDFGTHGAQRYVRFAYTTSQARIQEGLARIANALRAA